MAPKDQLHPNTSSPTLHDLLNFSGATFSPSPSPSQLAPSCNIDESYKYIFLPICYSFTFLFSLSLNSVVLIRSFRRTKRWNASLIYMVNLASTDFMYSLSLPFLVASYVMRDRWVFGDFMCRLVPGHLPPHEDHNTKNKTGSQTHVRFDLDCSFCTDLPNLPFCPDWFCNKGDKFDQQHQLTSWANHHKRFYEWESRP
uniref:G-protein coupled receptors family 1 profile domain-containing protein n=1 Tax=Knipowitschia caucasica TaxID=637954 RepID=A0AAV2KL60_KNICA